MEEFLFVDACLSKAGSEFQLGSKEAAVEETGMREGRTGTPRWEDNSRQVATRQVESDADE